MDKAAIYIVEDQSVIAMDLASRLVSLGYRVAGTSATGEEAVTRVAETRPDLVLMDIVLKGEMDGVQAASIIREQAAVPVVYLTAHSDEQTLQRARITQPYGYILKPFEDRELLSAIEMALYKHQIEHKLRRTERWLAATLRSIGDAVIATDEAGIITFVNPVAEELTGWPESAAVGRSITDILDLREAGTYASIVNPILLALNDGRPLELSNNTVLCRSDGDVPIDDTAAPIRDDTGRITGAVLVFKDVTERQQHAEAQRRMNAELQARNAELDAFAHTVAHDLKNPVHLLMGFTEVMQRDYDQMSKEEQHSSLNSLARITQKMSNIIEELLLLSSVRKDAIACAPLNTAYLVDEAQQRLAHLIQEKQAEIITPATWPSAIGHAPWVEEIWVNYLSNALKYGGRPARIEVGADQIDDGTIRFWVRDNGAGLTAEQQARLFQPFTQLSQVRAQGHGLGLSIVRRIVERLGGQVAVESRGLLGEGSTFSFTLPANPQ